MIEKEPSCFSLCNSSISSNYLGRGKFNDYYKDRNHFYTYLEKLDEVYQWRNEVFSRSRHLHRVQPLTTAEMQKLGNTPWDGGLVFPYRVVPKYFEQEGMCSKP